MGKPDSHAIDMGLSMQRISVVARKIISLPWLPAFLAATGFLAYLLQAIDMARTKTSFLDEG